MNMDNILKIIGWISIIEDPEKFRSLFNLIPETKPNDFEHGYYCLKTGNRYNGTVHIHGNGSPFSDGHGNGVIWR